jgi:hypothetical protein
MKGIITEYIEEKGFGFLKDKNEEKRFFHISGLKEKNKFLSNLTDYYFTDWEDRKCYVVNFTPGENSRGLNATNIILTDQIFNDKTLLNPFEILITDFKYFSTTLTRIVSGVKDGSYIPFGASRGGHGTYRIGYPEAFRKLNIHFRRIDDIGWGTIEVRDLVLNINDRSKITDRLVETLKENLVGRKVLITPTSVSWNLNDTSILKI